MESVERSGSAMAAAVRACATLLLAALAALAALAPLAGCDGGGPGDVIPPFWLRNGVVAADLNGDGRVDVAVVATYVAGPGPHDGFVEVHLQAADGTFADPVRYPVAADPWSLAAGDLDGDGRLDLVVASPHTRPIEIGAVSDSGAISALRQEAANPGRFLPAVTVATGGAANAAAIGSLTADTLADVVVADGILVNGRALLLAQDAARPGTLLAPVTLPVGAGQGSSDVAVGPVDGDALADIVLSATEAVAVLRQTPGGTFATTLHPVGLAPRGVALADLDGDGRTDIVSANAGHAPAGGRGGASVTVLLQTAPGAFTRTDLAVPDGARQVVVADLDDDTLPDLAVVSLVVQAQGEPSRVTVLRQSGAERGRFEILATYAGPMSAQFIAAADVNDDGFTDLVFGDGPSVMLQRPAAPGSFEPLRGLD